MIFRRFRNLPLERKLYFMALCICGAVLSLAACALFIFQIVTFRAGFERDIATVASIIANNSTAALAFNDTAAGAEILKSVKTKPSIICACLTDKSGKIISHTGTENDGDDLPAYAPAGRFRYFKGELLYSEQVTLDDRKLGRLYIRADYHPMLFRLLIFHGLVLSCVVIASALFAGHLSRHFCRFITVPILSLAETARVVGEKHDYSVRSPVPALGDELGVLATAFNHMLGRIQTQDAALTLSQHKLEAIVNSLDGVVWEWRPDQNVFTYVSRQTERLFGYPPERWIGDPGFWESILHPDDKASAIKSYEEVLARRQPYSFEYRVIAADGREVWLRESGVISEDAGQILTMRGIFLDITEQKNAAVELEKLNRQLMTASRQAGMAEVATGVLHNVGNVLNSVNVSAGLLREKLSRSEVRSLDKLAELLKSQNGNLPAFLAENPKGKLIPEFIIQIAERLSRERELFSNELLELGKNVEHIKDIVSMQQSHARVIGVSEKVSLVRLMEDVLRIESAALTRARIEVVRQFETLPETILDSHKVLQILLNLIRNARYAMSESWSGPRQLSLTIARPEPGRVRVTVTDSGVGISSQNLTRIFSHGFTTRKDGHGFGLHIGALHAKQMGGSLTGSSPGEGCGSSFTLELPFQNEAETKA
ncbi:MAG TPA: PAS domain-containing protein [Candidatus Paceibacterota bacterium]|nr:PAS domain-containing protein [Candidatus Paceibacterota bacterium]